MANKDTIKQRSIRVFISSTFLDMEKERNELVKYTFPKLRQQFEQREVGIKEVDLRWGITGKESEEGKALPICLEEIDNCRPFFIGILGHRYGTPAKKLFDKFPEALLIRHPWLKSEHLEKSFTELEILYGAFKKTEKTPYVYFYFLEPGKCSNEKEDSSIREDEDKVKLQNLKEQIKYRGFTPRIYSNAEHLGQLIYEDLKTLIETLFPEDSITGTFERENLAHQLFVENHSRLYFGKHSHFKHLENYVDSSSHFPFVLEGESGLGKSALLAAWLKYRHGALPANILLSTSILDVMDRFFKRFPFRKSQNRKGKELIIKHFVGASVESTNWINMLKRILTTLKEEVGINLPVPDQAEKLRSSFLNWLQVAAKKAKVILIIDGIDKLEDREQALDLIWLPEKLPGNIRLILSTNGGPSFEEIKRRGWPLFKIKPLKPNECKHFISTYLKQYSKSLDNNHIKQIVEYRQSQNPLFLKTVLEELRVSGSYANLTGRITHYIEADSPVSLFYKVLERCEFDYEKKRKGLVGDSMKLLWAARQGLNESELLDIIGNPGNPLPSSIWSPFYLAVKEFLVQRSGLLTFFHNTFRKAVEKRYLPGDDEKYSVHRCLANFFTHKEMTLRKIEELPWHLAAIGSWEELYSLLSNTKYLQKTWERHRLEVKSYWALLEQKSDFTMANGYAPLINAPGKYKDCLWQVCTLLADTAHIQEALELGVYLEQSSRKENNLENLQASLSMQAALLKNRRKFEKALRLLEEQEQICRRISNYSALAASLGNQGVLYMEKGNHVKAMKCFKEEEKICLEIDDLAGLSANNGNQGIIYLKNHQFDEALKLFLNQEKLCRQLGDIPGLQMSLGHQGIIFKAKGNIKSALKLYEEAETICRQLGDWEGIQALLGNQALIHRELGDYDRTMELLDEKEKICRKIDEPAKLVDALIQKFNLAAFYLKAISYAKQFIEEAYQIALKNNMGDTVHEIEKKLTSIRE